MRFLFPILASTLALALPAHAQPVIEGSPAGVPAPYSPAPVGLVGASDLKHRGDRVASVEAISAGESSGVPLNEALRMLLPPGWRASVRESVDQTRIASWAAGQTWVQALEGVARDQGISMTLQWSHKLVFVDPKIGHSYAAAPSAPAAVAPVAQPAPDPLPQLPAATDDTFGASPASTGAPTPDLLFAPAMNEQVRTQSARPPLYRRASDSHPPAQPGYPGATRPVTQEAEAHYPGLQEFLDEEVRVDRVNTSLSEVLAVVLPVGWHADFRTDNPGIAASRIDVTFAGSRGDLLNALGRESGLAMIPYLEFNKIIVADGRK